MHTIFVHPLREAFSQTTRLALIAVRLVDGARSGTGLATVDQSATNTALEETGAAIAGKNTLKIPHVSCACSVYKLSNVP